MPGSLASLLIWLLILAFVILILVLLERPERIVTPGRYSIIDAAKICPSLPRCFYQNVETPYGRPLFNTPDSISALDAFIGGTYLTELEAVVLIGQVPQANYWSYIPYLYRQATTGAAGSGPVLFASLSDGISNFMIHLPEGNNQVAIIATRNRIVYERERNFLLTAKGGGFSGTIFPLFFTDVVTSNDILVILSRATTFNSDQDRRNYIQAPGMTTYKVSYDDLANVPIPASVPTQNLKPNGIKLKTLTLTPTEIPLATTLNNYANYLLQDYTVVQDVSIKPFLNDVLGVPYNNGYQCIATSVNCSGDNRQTYYGVSVGFTAPAGQKVLVVAVNHAAYGRAIYSQISIYDNSLEFGLASVTHYPRDDLFYSHVFTLDSDGYYLVGERAYIDPAEDVGPDANSLLTALAYVVVPK